MKETPNSSTAWTSILLHLVVWSAFLSFPVLLLTSDAIDWTGLFLRHWIPLGFSALLFYVNYFLLIRLFLFRSKIALFLGINLLIILALLGSFEIIKEAILPLSNPANLHKPFKTYFYFRVFISYLLPVGVSVAIRSTQRFLRSEMDYKNKENERLKTELSYLHYQIQPHFFFNSLNTVYALIAEAPDQAQKALHQLSKLMRYVLYDSSHHTVKLSQEIDFLTNYIRLMQVRQGHIIDLETAFPNPVPELDIAPLLFIPLLENAFKHSVHPSEAARIHVKLSASNSNVIFEIRNSNHPKSGEDQSGRGIGLKNLRQRLEYHYPEKHILVHESQADEFFTQLRIHL